VSTLEFFYDYASPWSYMAFCRIEDIAREAGAQLAWRPVSMGAVFQKANPGVAHMRAAPVPAKVRHYYKDMTDWARRLGIVIGRPPVYGGASRQLDSAFVLRGALLALERDLISPYTRAMYEAYWHELRDLADLDTAVEVAARVGLEPGDFRRMVEGEQLARMIERNVDELVARGGFGVPTFFVEGADMYFGNDRLEFVREALLAAA